MLAQHWLGSLHCRPIYTTTSSKDFYDTTLTRHSYTYDMSKDREKSIPKTRLGRFGRVARMAGGVAAGMVSEGAKQLAKGNRPKMKDLILTPGNARKVAKQLAAMRGAAMKVGQLLSMESADFLPPQLAEILAQLRDRAFIMPRQQLIDSLVDSYGEDWESQFKRFDYEPLAAASIGQVHRAITLDDEDIVLKIQYPGVAESIDSDVDNIAGLLRVSRLLPKHLDITELLEDAKAQLHEEADYQRELEHLKLFQEALGKDDRFIVPKCYEAYCTKTILAMEYVEGVSVDRIDGLKPTQVDQLMGDLFSLMLQELFDFRTMQTDPNFANYLYQASSGRIVLLDFGATRSFTKKFATDYKRLIRGVMADDREKTLDAADRLGYVANNASVEYQDFLVNIFNIALESFQEEGAYDFENSRLSERIAELSEDAYGYKEFWQTPPSSVLYLHRKLGGMFLLAMRMGAQVDVNAMVKPYVKTLA